MGRFLTKDSWQGDYYRPLSLNRWNYVEGNPVNYTDPSGLCGIPGEPPCPPGQGENGAVSWWTNLTQVYVEGLGYFDTGHLKRGWHSAEFFVGEIEATLKRGGGVFQNPATSTDKNNKVVYEVYYSISAQFARDYRRYQLGRDQIFGMAYGMYINFERGYEEYQSRLFLSSFSPADLPSDHLGFWAYMNGYAREEIPTLLQCLGEVEVLPWYQQLPGGAIFDSTGIPKNHEFLPMTNENINVAWPTGMEIRPIPSGPNTWQKVREWHK
jgi:hypothetical protein